MRDMPIPATLTFTFLLALAGEWRSAIPVMLIFTVVQTGMIQGTTVGVIKGDARTLDHGSYKFPVID